MMVVLPASMCAMSPILRVSDGRHRCLGMACSLLKARIVPRSDRQIVRPMLSTRDREPVARIWISDEDARVVASEHFVGVVDAADPATG